MPIGNVLIRERCDKDARANMLNVTHDVDFHELYNDPPKRNQREEGQLDMTPMVDVTFLLLIFFILASWCLGQTGNAKYLVSKAYSHRVMRRSVMRTMACDEL